MTYTRPPAKYDPVDQGQLRDAIQKDVDRSYKRGESIELWPNTSVFVRSPDNQRWKITVSNAGALVVTAA